MFLLRGLKVSFLSLYHTYKIAIQTYSIFKVLIDHVMRYEKKNPEVSLKLSTIYLIFTI